MKYIKDKHKVFFAFLITICLWASAFPVIKIALNDFKAENLSALRLLIACILLLAAAIFKKVKFPDIKDLPVILLLGFCGFTLYHTALSFGEYYVSAGVASLLVSTTPIFSALIATYFLKEKFSRLVWLGSIIAFIGVALISLGNDNAHFNAMLFGVILILIASIGESIYFAFQSKYLKKYGFIPLTIYTIISGALFTIIFLPGAFSEVPSASTETIFAVIYLGAFPTVIPYIALAYMIFKIGVSEGTMSLYLTPAVSLVIAYLLLGEVPSFIAVAGGIIILIGVTITSKHAEESV